MEPIRDPEGKEVEHLQRFARLDGARVLEIGCGSGRLTRIYGHSARSVVGIDEDDLALADARQDTPEPQRGRLSWICAAAEELPLPARQFDTALFAWSL